MKIVKEYLNEIKQNSTTSGLSSIGIGSAGMTKAYKYMKANWPDFIDNPDYLNDIFLNSSFKKKIAYVESKLKIDINNYIFIENGALTINSRLENWLKEIKWDKKIIISGSSWDSHNVQSAKYNYDYNIGLISFSNEFWDDNKIFGWIFKYK